MPDWKASVAYSCIFNLVLLSGAVTMLVYSEGVLRNSTVEGSLYNGFVTPFQDFSLTSFTSFAACLGLAGLVGFLFTGILDHLNRTRQRPNPARIACDSAFDVVAALYVILLVGCIIAAVVTACFSTFLYVSARDVDASCPGKFGFDAAEGDVPNDNCAFDNAAYMVIHGSIGSTQLASVWSAIQDEFGCCGYWCSQGNTSQACLAGANTAAENAWQMEACYQVRRRVVVVCVVVCGVRGCVVGQLDAPESVFTTVLCVFIVVSRLLPPRQQHVVAGQPLCRDILLDFSATTP